MQIKLSGMLIDKYVSENKDKITGQVKSTLKLVIYQKESHQAITVTAEQPTYSKAEEMKLISLNCELGSFVSNGKAIQYFKEIAVA
jgi:hypothetical protein